MPLPADPILDDRLIFTPHDVDLTRSPLAPDLAGQTHILAAFNPGFTRLPNGNLLMMVRVAEALKEPETEGHVRSIRWDAGRFVVDHWPLAVADTSDPRAVLLRGQSWPVLILTSLSWLLPVELTPDGQGIVAVHYDRAVAPRADWQCYGVEDARISRVDGRYWMTTCSVSPMRQGTSLYTSDNGLDWRLEGLVLDHQNKDMLIFEGRIGGEFWAQTRPLGHLFFAYPPGSPWLPGPSINLASSPDGLHWKPREGNGIRPTSAGLNTERIGGGTPPILTPEGWLTLWHGVTPVAGEPGIYRTYWSLLAAHDPCTLVRAGTAPLLEANPALTAPLEDIMYLRDIVFTTGIVDAGEHYVIASGECDLACRITRIDKAAFLG